MPIRRKIVPVAATPATPIVVAPRVRTRPSPVVAPTKIIRDVMVSTVLREIAPGVHCCASALARRIPGRPDLQIQIMVHPDPNKSALEVIVFETGELLGSFQDWEGLEEAYGAVLPSSVAKLAEKRAAKRVRK